MLMRIAIAYSVLLAALTLNTVARACGDGEAPVSCDDPSPNGFASWMLKRADQALKVDKVAALTQFSAGTHGFRTADTYVFCVGSDGVMSAHPNAILRGQQVTDLHDRTGNYFIQTMLREAKPERIAVIHYLFPKPGGTVEEPKTTYYTRSDDQMCAVGVYDSDTSIAAQVSPEAQLAKLQQRVDRQIPTAARADWTAFLEALNQTRDAQAASLIEVRRSLKAAIATLDHDAQAATRSSD